MIPQTIHKMAALECVSAMQKCIRRGMEREAMEFACELGHTSKAFVTMVCNRLQLISHEDIGLAAPEVIPLVRVCCQQAREFYDAEKQGKWRMFVGTAIRALCRAPKSREGDHFQAAVGLRSQLQDFVPEIPDFAHDMHTRKGKAMGRGLEHFRKAGARLSPAPRGKDPYEEECYEMWTVRDAGKAKAKEATLF